MKLLIKGITIALLAAGLAIPATADSVKGMSLNGATGLISIPDGRIGWQNSQFGLDVGYHAIFDDTDTDHIPAVSVSLLKWFEFSFAYDSQVVDKSEDLLFGGKIQLPTKGTAVAIGGNIQKMKQADYDTTDYQVYLAATYPGSFFTMPAETTVVVGKTFYDDDSNKRNVDFGMGFDLNLLPSIFENYVHWLIDFSNFSYSTQAIGSDSYYRGSLNTGIRINIAAHPSLKNYKLVVDAYLTDALDGNRCFALGVSGGIPLN